MNVKRLSPISAVFLANLFAAFHYYLIVYINSSQLSEFFSEEHLGLLYIIGSAASFFLFLHAPRIMKRLGVYPSLLLAACIESAAILGLAGGTSAFTIGLSFLLHQIILVIMLLGLDIFLETEIQEEGATGRIRSVYLTLANAALVISPLLIAFLVPLQGYQGIYLLSALFMVPFFTLLTGNLSRVKVKAPEKTDILPSLQELLRNRNVRNITGAHLMLQIFYAFMVIYTPLYLHEQLGFSWAVLGTIFTIMVLPFVLFQIPAGKLADERWGEQELMIFGFLVIILALLLFPFITEASFLLWAGLLFLSRTGASIAEVTTESYFFKQVKGENGNLISLFRSTRSLGYILAPALGNILLVTVPFRFIFPVLGAFMAFAIFFSGRIVDSK